MRKIKNMDPVEIRIALLRSGVTQSQIARDLGVGQPMVNRVIDGIAVSHRIRKAISDITGIALERLWPDPYLYHGGPRKPGRPFGSGPIPRL